jgi:cytochrome c-type biogenesis protein CcmH
MIGSRVVEDLSVRWRPGVVMFWLMAACLTAVAVAIVARPLRLKHGPLAAGTSTPEPSNEAEGDLAVYRDQLAELEQDVARGHLTAEDATAARLELSRRILARADRAAAAAEAATAPTSGRPGFAVWLAAVGVPLVGLGFYLLSGMPRLPDQPRLARTGASAELSQVSELIAKVESRIAENPNDGRGWEVLSPVYLKQGRFPEAITAYGNALRLLGESVPRLAGLAEAHVKAANGVINDAAKTAYTRILTLEPTRIEPRFWLAMALEQDGKPTEAAAAYEALLAGAPADAPWRPPVLERLALIDPAAAARLQARPGPSQAPTGNIKGPTAADMAAAGQMTPEARAKMIAGMVAGLEQRLSRDGGDVDGWQKLMRAFMVMGNKDKAQAALRNAQAALANNKDGLAAVNAAARTLGIGS